MTAKVRRWRRWTTAQMRRCADYSLVTPRAGARTVNPSTDLRDRNHAAQMRTVSTMSPLRAYVRARVSGAGDGFNETTRATAQSPVNGTCQ